MPNGNPKFHEEEFPILESFFSKVANVLSEFGSTHNLKLEKYYHDNPSWRFNFQHPKGGIASIDVVKESDDSVRICRYWWIDDYDKFSRYIKRDESKTIKISDVNLIFLKNQLEEILSWKLSEWTQTATGYENYWKPQGKDWIEKDVEKYPKPRITF
ncbi:MAG: hypothetical protein H0X15_10855 [Acidobacteria bacterium]|jgi:hypothetical protein|nr:hypothetical protein [Acidobacteriota bacterium]